jgi:hypothetical protein
MQVDGALSYTQMLLGIDETANSEYYNDYLQRPASYEVKKYSCNIQIDITKCYFGSHI